jgi:hypothetical protein
MPQAMVILVVELTGNASVRHVAVSLPFVAALVDGRKYYMPDTVPRPEGYMERAPRGPTLRSLVKLALRCQSAEEMGKQLKRRFDRSLRRRGIEPRRDRRAEAEIDRLLGEPTSRNHHCT